MESSDKQFEIDGKLYKRLHGQWVDCSSGLISPSTIAARLDRLLYQSGDPTKIPPASSLLFFWTWKNYVSDMQELGGSCQLNQDNRLILSLKKWDHIWAFTRRDEKTYVLAMDLVVELIRQNKLGDPGARYGKYCAVGNPQACRYFAVEAGPDAEPTIRQLSFFREDVKVDTTGQMLQGINAVRSITMEEHLQLMAFSQKCATL